MVERTGEPAQSRTLPPPPETEPDFEALAAIAAEYGCEVIAE